MNFLYKRSILNQVFFYIFVYIKNTKKTDMKKTFLLAAIFVALIIASCSSGTKDENTKDTSETNEEVVKTAIMIEGDKVNFREKPDLKSSLINQLNTSDKVMMLEKGKQQKIGNLNDFWYKIEYKGKTGWVYGAFTSLRLKAPEKPKNEGVAIGEILRIVGDDYYMIRIRNARGEEESFDLRGDFEGSENIDLDGEGSIGEKVKIYYKDIEEYFEPAGGMTEFRKVMKVELVD